MEYTLFLNKKQSGLFAQIDTRIKYSDTEQPDLQIDKRIGWSDRISIAASLEKGRRKYIAHYKTARHVSKSAFILQMHTSTQEKGNDAGR